VLDLMLTVVTGISWWIGLPVWVASGLVVVGIMDALSGRRLRAYDPADGPPLTVDERIAASRAVRRATPDPDSRVQGAAGRMAAETLRRGVAALVAFVALGASLGVLAGLMAAFDSPRWWALAGPLALAVLVLIPVLYRQRQQAVRFRAASGARTFGPA
jgi:hypothetical protein